MSYEYGSREADYVKVERARVVTRRGQVDGTIPSVCPICKSLTTLLLLHHWGGPKSWAVKSGSYRRLCRSCNQTLRRLYSNGVYPSWEEQYRTLTTEVPGWRVFHPSFDGIEGWWSLFTSTEIDFIDSKS